MTAQPPKRRLRRWFWLLWLVAGLLVGALVGMAAAVVLTPPVEVTEQRALSTATVTEGKIGSVVSLSARSEWPTQARLPNAVVGVVTHVGIADGQTIAKPVRAYEVNGRPVFLAEGTVPAYRDIDASSKGTDVRQLQRMLAKLGFDPGRADGTGDSALSRAVRAWQNASGYPVDGRVQAGDVIFVPKFPARVRLARAGDSQTGSSETESAVLTVGARLSDGQVVLDRLASDPVITITAAKEQASRFTVHTPVVIGYGNHRWSGIISAATILRDDLVLTVKAAGGGPVCGDECADLPVTSSEILSADIQVVAPTAGLTVPAVAIQTHADGSTFVVKDTGQEVAVRVIAGDAGVAIIEGVAVGTRVRLSVQESPR